MPRWSSPGGCRLLDRWDQETPGHVRQQNGNTCRCNNGAEVDNYSVAMVPRMTHLKGQRKKGARGPNTNVFPFGRAHKTLQIMYSTVGCSAFSISPSTFLHRGTFQEFSRVCFAYRIACISYYPSLSLVRTAMSLFLSAQFYLGLRSSTCTWKCAANSVEGRMYVVSC